MRKVLFITYYWPPSGKASLHWPLAVIKHLPKFDWEPLVLTVENESFTQKDYSLLDEINPELKVYKTKAVEVFNLYKRFIGKKKDEHLSVSETMSKNKGIRQRISLWIRMNVFIPDARVLWYPSAVKGGKKLLRLLEDNPNSKPVDAIISIGTPHSTHLIGKKLSGIFDIPHIPLFSDPWTSISYYKKFNRNFFAEKLDNRFERKVVENAAAVIFVTNNTKQEYIDKYPLLKNKSFVLYWGYNEENFTALSSSNQTTENEKTLLHTGNLFDYQNPMNLWKTIRIKIENGEKVKIRFTGTVGPAIIKSLEQSGLSGHYNLMGFLPYNELIAELNNADYFLLCPYDKRHIPGKLFEYLRAGKPIIAFCDENNEVKSILEELNAGMLFNYDDPGNEFFEKANNFKTELNLVKKFDRYEITGQLAEILNNL